MKHHVIATKSHLHQLGLALVLVLGIAGAPHSSYATDDVGRTEIVPYTVLVMECMTAALGDIKKATISDVAGAAGMIAGAIDDAYGRRDDAMQGGEVAPYIKAQDAALAALWQQLASRLSHADYQMMQRFVWQRLGGLARLDRANVVLSKSRPTLFETRRVAITQWLDDHSMFSAMDFGSETAMADYVAAAMGALAKTLASPLTGGERAVMKQKISRD